MTKVEARITASFGIWAFVIRHSFVIRASSFDISSEMVGVKLVMRGVKLATEAPVNGGRNYDGPKVAKFLVG